MDHPDLIVLYELISGQMAPADRARVEAHVDRCAPCAAAAEQARALWDSAQAQKMAIPLSMPMQMPASGRSRGPSALPPAGTVIELEPVFDSREAGVDLQPEGVTPSSGVGGEKKGTAGSRPPRRLLFSGGGYDLDLLIEGAPGAKGRARLAVRGRILGLEAPDGGLSWTEVSIEPLRAKSAGGTMRAAVDEEGVFSLAPLAAVSYRLTLTGEGYKVVVSLLDLA